MALRRDAEEVTGGLKAVAVQEQAVLDHEIQVGVHLRAKGREDQTVLDTASAKELDIKSRSVKGHEPVKLFNVFKELDAQVFIKYAGANVSWSDTAFDYLAVLFLNTVANHKAKGGFKS